MMSLCGCPDALAFTRMTTGSPEELEALREHAATCPSCAERLDSLDLLRELSQELPDEPLDEARRESVRTTLLTADLDPPETRSPRRNLFIALAAAAVLLVGLGAWWFTRPGKEVPVETPPSALEESSPAPAENTRGVALALSDDTRFERLSALPDEVIRLTDGSIRVEVESLKPGERFRVIVGEGEVEVHGTIFEVVAEAGVLTSVRVLEGEVEVRPGGHAKPRKLRVEEQWTLARAMPSEPIVEPSTEVAEPVVAAPVVESVERKAAPRRKKTRRKRVEPKPEEPRDPAVSADEVAFQRGWRALSEGRAAEAAEAFEAALAASPSASVKEDARFWLGVALERSGRRAGAIRALTRFLESHPKAARAGEASVILGWMLLDEGDEAGARARFEAARDDAVPSVRESARAGLEQLR